MKGAVVYVRVSTADQVENLSLSTQLERCRAFCDREGYDVLEVFEERGESAKTAHRTEFQRAIKWCKENRRRVDAFVVYSFDRFCRSTLDHATYRTLLAGFGIRLCAVTQPTDNSPAGEFVETLLAAHAQLDNRLRAERTVDGMKAAQTRGRWTHKAPLGYVNGPRDGPSLLPDPERAPLVTATFERLASGTASKRDVLRALRNEGMVTRGGRPVAVQTFQRMIRNPTYAGRLVTSWDVESVGDWQPLVSEELFDRVQLILDGKKPAPRKRVRSHEEFPLKGFTRCARCGRPLTAEIKKGRFRYYRCVTPKCIGTVARDKLHEAFTALLDTLRPRPEYIRLFREICLREHEAAHQTKGSDRRRLEQRRDDLLAQKKKLGRELARGILDSNSYRELRDDVDAELAEVRVALSETTVEEVNIESVLDFAQELFLDPAKMWRNLNPAQRLIFQSSIFPEGAAFDGKSYRTPVTASFIARLREVERGETRLASPTGFEPVLPP